MKIITHLNDASLTTLLIQCIIAYEWISGGWSKLASRSFAQSMEKTLFHFEQGNPHGWYIRSILSFAKQHAELFGQLVQWGEILTGIGLLVGLLLYVFSKNPSVREGVALISILALLGGLLMNLNFYVAAGWTSPSTSGLNVLMFWTEGALLLFWVKTYLGQK